MAIFYDSQIPECLMVDGEDFSDLVGCNLMIFAHHAPIDFMGFPNVIDVGKGGRSETCQTVAKTVRLEIGNEAQKQFSQLIVKLNYDPPASDRIEMLGIAPDSSPGATGSAGAIDLQREKFHELVPEKEAKPASFEKSIENYSQEKKAGQYEN